MNAHRPQLNVLDGGRSPSTDPFTVAEYVQLAALGHHCVSVIVLGPNGGEIVMHHGVPWSARDAQGQGAMAFRRLVLVGGMEADAPVVCRSVRSEPNERNIYERVEALLMDAAKSLDDRRRSLDASRFESSRDEAPDFEYSRIGPGGFEGRSASTLIDEGVEALLDKDYGRAYDVFSRAYALKLDDGIVATNLQRLRELGYGAAGDGT